VPPTTACRDPRDSALFRDSTRGAWPLMRSVRSRTTRRAKMAANAGLVSGFVAVATALPSATVLSFGGTTNDSSIESLVRLCAPDWRLRMDASGKPEYIISASGQTLYFGLASPPKPIECLDWRLGRELPGHEVKSVQDMGWNGIKNGRLLALAQENSQARDSGRILGLSISGLVSVTSPV